jgi:hypothetical protein
MWMRFLGGTEHSSEADKLCSIPASFEASQLPVSS